MQQPNPQLAILIQTAHKILPVQKPQINLLINKLSYEHNKMVQPPTLDLHKPLPLTLINPPNRFKNNKAKPHLND
jgi:hypothetical protein